MQRKKETIVVHPLFGKIRIEEKFQRVLELKPFRDLACKSQLGTKIFSNELLNTRHTRLMHSIGTMYLTEELINICEEKFEKYFTITKQDREILKLAALGHDLGHIAFSHSLEDKKMKSHEQRTVEYFDSYSEQINEIFGYDIVSGVIQVYTDKNNMLNVDCLNVLFIFKSLLIGAIDCDRMEYITTDRFNVYGERVNYKDIFKYITIVLLNDSPTVGFEKSAVPLIEEMLFTRFNQYLEIYYDADSTLTEMMLKEYKSIEDWGEEETVDKAEYEVLAELKSILSDPEEQGTVRYRIAEILIERKRDDIFLKKFENYEDYICFKAKLTGCINRDDIIKVSKKKIELYNPDKNKVYIKDDDGVVKDLMEVSYKIRNISVACYYVMVDLNSVYNISQADKDKIIELFSDNPVEIEKKYIPKEEGNKEDWIRKINDVLKSMPNIQVEDFSKWDKIENDDLYFEAPKELPKEIAMRCRTTDKEKAYYLKTPADDGTVITKRYEDKFYFQSDEEFFETIIPLLKAKGYGYYSDNIHIKEGVRIKTERHKTLAYWQDCVIEIACDFSMYQYAGKIAYGVMLECESKDGEDIALWYLNKHLKSQGFVETNKSKQAIAKMKLEIK